MKSATTNYGTFNVSGVLASGAAQFGSLTGVTAGAGSILPAFYGPNGQEFGGPFRISIPTATTTIVGGRGRQGRVRGRVSGRVGANCLLRETKQV